MRKLGVDAKVAVLDADFHNFTKSYRDIPGVADLFIGFRAETGEDSAHYAALDEMFRRFRIVAQAADECGEVKADTLLMALSRRGTDASRNGEEKRAMSRLLKDDLIARDLTGPRDALRQLRESFQAIDAESSRLTRRVQGSETARLALENSTFWRISGPLRRLLNRLRGH